MKIGKISKRLLRLTFGLIILLFSLKIIACEVNSITDPQRIDKIENEEEKDDPREDQN